MRSTRLRKNGKPNLRRASQYPQQPYQRQPPRPTPFERSPIPFLAPSQFSRIQEFGERFKRIVSEPIFKRSSGGDEEDFTSKIKPRKRPPPPWLAEKMYGSRQDQDQNDQDQGSEEDQEDGGFDDGPPLQLRRRIR